ncbi:MAG: class I tRNA ligase family protein, partial [Patescibacteria group bacterium]
MEKYDHRAIEKKWQKHWEEHEVFHAEEKSHKESRFILDMFPYPSAQGLHVGHPEGYTASDIYSRYLRMKGFNVLHPMGFDAFGLPAENYAIKTGTHPADTTEKNIDNMRRQIQSLGFSYDWSREVITSDPQYYRWTQWIFVQLFKRGLAYEAYAPINWCPKDKTGLANEEVVDGKCERCGTQVTIKKVKQWLVKITDERYIERLLDGLDTVDWPENIIAQQKNWIGKSEGMQFRSPIKDTVLTVETFSAH